MLYVLTDKTVASGAKNLSGGVSKMVRACPLPALAPARRMGAASLAFTGACRNRSQLRQSIPGQTFRKRASKTP